MNIIIIKDKLKEAVDNAVRVITERSDLPILKNILISAQDGKINITGTNLEIAVTCSVLGKIIEPGSITVPASSFSSLLQNLKSERITLEKKDTVLQIITDNYEAKLQTLPSDDYPLVPKIKEKDNWIEIESNLFRETLQQVLAAAQISELRQELNVVLLIYTPDELTFVATDSSRLAEKRILKTQFSSHGHHSDFSLLIPLQTAQQLVSIISTKGILKIFFDENQILFQGDQIECISRRAEGNFPDYKTIIPKKFETEITIKRDEFIQALKLGASLTSRISEVLLRVHVDKKALEIFFKEEGIGENKSFIPVKINGVSKEISFNWRYILDGLKEISTNDIVFGFNEENKPTRISSLNDASYIYIVMPILK